MAANPRIRLEIAEAKKKLMTLIIMLERGVPSKVKWLYYITLVHIYMSAPA
jgi:hypothetical protein